MTEREALRATIGVRVKDTRFNETGTLVDRDVSTQCHRTTLVALSVKLDEPPWLGEIHYWINNKSGRKIRDLEFM